MKKLFLISILSILLVSFVSAQTQPTQQFNKIFFDPFYRQSMVAQDYNYTVTVNPPDGFSDVISAMVTFQMWLSPTVEFFILVDGQACNTVSYEVHTTYAGAGEGTIFFDCSNIINQPGIYTITLTPDDDTGAVTGWLDLTYMNNPKGAMELLGTEYSPNDAGTIFLQLKDAQGSSVLDGSCFIDVYNPLLNGSHTYYLQDAPMIYDGNDDGLYYYDLTIPDVLGNYMLAAKCSYSYQTPLWVYGPFSQSEAIETRISGGVWSGSSQALNDKADSLYEKCVSSSGTEGCLTTWEWTLPAGDYASNASIVNVYYSGQSDRNRLMHLDCLNISNGSTYIDFTNQLTYTGDATGTTPTQVDDFVTNVLPDGCINETENEPNVTIRFYINTNGAVVYHNWLSLLVLAASGNVQDLKGSSEMHVTDVGGDVSEEVWAYDNRTLTFVDHKIIIHGTYYEPGDNGRVSVQLLSGGEANSNAVCILDIYKPSDNQASKEYLVDNGLLINLQENGLYYYDFIAPNETGIYMVTADCAIGENTTTYNASSATLFEGSITGGDVSDTWYSDDSYLVINEQVNGPGNRSYVQDFYFDLSSQPSDVTFGAIVFEGRLNPNNPETVQFQLYNYTGGYFLEPFANVLVAQSAATDVIVANTGDASCVVPGGDCLNASNFTRLRLSDTLQVGDNNVNTIRIDLLRGGVTHQVFEPAIGIAGGSEINVRSPSAALVSQVWSYDNRTLTNATNIAQDIWGGNYTISVNMLQQIAQNIWEYVARYIHGEIV